MSCFYAPSYAASSEMNDIPLPLLAVFRDSQFTHHLSSPNGDMQLPLGTA